MLCKKYWYSSQKFTGLKDWILSLNVKITALILIINPRVFTLHIKHVQRGQEECTLENLLSWHRVLELWHCLEHKLLGSLLRAGSIDPQKKNGRSRFSFLLQLVGTHKSRESGKCTFWTNAIFLEFSSCCYLKAEI